MKKLLSLFVCAAMLLSTAGTVFASDDAIEISTAEGLAGISENLSGTYVLTADIDLSDYSSWQPIGTFRGRLDGGEHKITGLNVSFSTEDTETGGNGPNLGLFSETSGAYISNLIIEGSVNVNVEIGEALGISVTAGLLAGSCEVSDISNVAVEGDVTVSVESENNYANATVGLLVGETRDGWVNGCNAAGIISITAVANAESTAIDAGALAGYSSSKVGSCRASGGITSSATLTNSSDYSQSCVGGLIGNNGMAINECSANVAVSSTINSSGESISHDVGGLAGANHGMLDYSSASGTVIANTVSTSESTGGDVSTMAGGVTGYCSEAISNNYATGAVSVEASTVKQNNDVQAGGLVGYLSQEIYGVAIADSYATGSVTATSASTDGQADVSAGGLVAIDYAAISNCYAEGNVTAAATSQNASANSQAGGLTGIKSQNGNVENCYAEGDVKSKATSKGAAYNFSAAGGLVSEERSARGIITNCYATGDVSSETVVLEGCEKDTHSQAGGLVGKGIGIIEMSYATGNVKSVSDSSAATAQKNTVSCAGGLIGYNTGEITNSYSRGNSASTAKLQAGNTYNSAGGFAGENASGTIGTSYSTGTAALTSNITNDNVYENLGGFVGYSSGTLENCYYDTQTSGVDDSRATGLTTANMKKAASLEGFDFDNVWGINSKFNNGYPAFAADIPKEDFAGLSVTDKTVTYNGEEQTLDVVGLPDGVSVEYECMVGDTSHCDGKIINAGTYEVKATVSAAGYNDWSDTATLTIEPKAITVDGLTATTREYDGRTWVALTGGSFVGLAERDNLEARCEHCNEYRLKYMMPENGNYADANAGENKAVTMEEIILTNCSAGNYVVEQPQVKGTIEKRSISIITDTFSIDSQNAAFDGVLPGDELSLDFDSLKYNPISTTEAKLSNFVLKGEKSANYKVTNGADLPVVPIEAEEIADVPLTKDENVTVGASKVSDDTIVITELTVSELPEDKTVSIDASAISDANINTVAIPKATVAQVAGNPDAQLEITLKTDSEKTSTILLDSAALQAINTAGAAAAALSFSAESVSAEGLESEQTKTLETVSSKSPVVYSLAVTDENGSSLAASFGAGAATALLPYEKPAGNIVAEWLKEDGSTETISNPVYDSTAKTVKLVLAHFSEYLIYTEPEAPTHSSSGGSSKCTVIFETNGGSDVAAVKINRNDIVERPADPTREGYIFDGWYIDKELETPYDFATKVTSSLRIYAKWIEAGGGKTEEGLFDDVKADDWFYDSVKYVVDNKLMNGVSQNEFAPEDNLTRAMLVTILYRNEGEPATNRSIPFADVNADDYYSNAVIWAQQNGIVNGITETEFEPNSNITREQIAAIIYRYAQYKSYDVSVGEDTNILSYEDVASISEYAIPALQYAAGSGLIKGKSESTLNPLDNATRAEIATILQRFTEGNK